VVLQSSKGATVALSYLPSKASSVKGQAKTRACAVVSPLPASQNQFTAVQELSERSWRGDPPGPLEALKGTGMQSATSTLAHCMG